MNIYTLEDLKNNVDKGLISQKQVITYLKNKKNIDLLNELIDSTNFLDIFENVTIDERIYCFLNNIDMPLVCTYCVNKRKWSGRFDIGYRETCGNPECKQKLLNSKKLGNNIISFNRGQSFLEWQQSIKSYDDINDDIIKKYIKYANQIKLIVNPLLIKYLTQRFSDSDSLEETLKRIHLGIEEKPKCLICGKPVKFIGKSTKMFTTYCGNSCSNKAKYIIR